MDLIDRQAAIEALWKIKDERDSVYYTSAIHTAIDAMEHLPSAQPEIRYYGQFEIKDPILISEWHWIPVSERLPEENKIVLITFDERVEMGRMCGESWEWLFESGWSYWIDIDNVTAWMPLPDPYKGE